MTEVKPLTSRTTYWLRRILWPLVLIIIGYFGFKFFYEIIFPLPSTQSLSVSAFYEEVNDTISPFSSLKITGGVQKDGKEIQQGIVKITVGRYEGILPAFESKAGQSLQTEVVNGKFELFNVGNFAEFNCTSDSIKFQKLNITVDVWSSELDESLSAEIFINVDETGVAITIPILVCMIILFFLFLYIFTGPATRTKNKVAFRFSYLIIFLSLGLPLLAPTVLTIWYPEIIDNITESPVGLVITEIEKLDGGGTIQWALNIGGFVTKVDRLEDTTKFAITNTVTKANSLEKPRKFVTSNYIQNSIRKINGGLVIPLFVLILSILGGAINMTRKVPDYQYDKQAIEGQFESHFKKWFNKYFGFAFFIVKQQTKNNNDDKAKAEGHETTEAKDEGKEPTEAKEWRKNLLNEYMVLISAPFLGIATYYMMYWLDILRTPALVLVSFSVGLISGSIIERIKEFGESMIKSNKLSLQDFENLEKEVKKLKEANK